MPTLNPKTRNDLIDLIMHEILLVGAKAQSIADKHWKEAEDAVAVKLGYADSLVRAEFLKNQIEGLQTELRDIETNMVERAKQPTLHEFLAAGIDVQADQHGRVRYPLPRVFNHEIKTVWDLSVLTHLNETLNFFKVWAQVSQLSHSVKREMLLAGTFEEARVVYQRFHEHVKNAVGTELPGLLSDLEAMPALKAPGEI